MSIVSEIIKENGYKIIDKFIKPSEWTRPQIRINPIGEIIHWTANISHESGAMANRNFFNNRHGSYGSAHVCGDDREIIGCLPYMQFDAEMGYHVGAHRYYTNDFGTYPNSHLLGYEMCVNRDGDFRESYKRAVWTMAHWASIYNWNIDFALRRHYDITRKDCALPMLDLIYDDRHLLGKGWSKTDIKWMRDNLHIDGIQGEKLWIKFKSDVKELQSVMTNGNIDKNKIKEKVIVKMSKYFKDVSASHWGTPFLDDLYEKGITKGDGKGHFMPNDNITRIEAAVLVDQAVNYILKEMDK